MIVKWIEKVFDIKCVLDCLMIIRVIVCEVVVTVLLVYVPQTGLNIAEKELFFWQPRKPCPD